MKVRGGCGKGERRRKRKKNGEIKGRTDEGKMMKMGVI